MYDCVIYNSITTMYIYVSVPFRRRLINKNNPAQLLLYKSNEVVCV